MLDVALQFFAEAGGFLLVCYFIFLGGWRVGGRVYIMRDNTRVPYKNGMSRLRNMLEIYHSGPEPSILL